MSQVRDHEIFGDVDAELVDDPELDAELEASIEELERGESVDGNEVLRRLRNGEYDAPPDRRGAGRYMSSVRDLDAEEDAIELTGEEAEELDAAMAEADASNPDDWMECGEFLRRLRNGE